MLQRDNGFDALLEMARARARTEGRRVLVSSSERISQLDPLEALKRVARGPVAAGIKAAARNKMYWTRRAEGFALAGVGAVATFNSSGADRFKLVDAEFRSLLENAITNGNAAGHRAVGPLAMGGFSFESAGPHSSDWNGFGSSQLFIPACVLTAVSGECWLTVSNIVNADGTTGIEKGILDNLVNVLTRPSDDKVFEPEAAALADLEFASLTGDDHWRDIVAAAVSAIENGDLQKVVLARAVRAEASEQFDIFTILRHLSGVYPDAFTFGFWNDDRAFVGASPERLARLEKGEIAASSLAGTIERGATPEEDEANAIALRNSAKDRAEHAAVRDVLYSALAETCYDVVAPEEPALLTLANVHHLHTPLRARLRPAKSLLDVVDHLHPTPAVGGTPREAALQFIDANEDLDRGWYAGPVGWIGRDSGEFAVALRSALIHERSAILFGGCGIVADSDPELELAESNLKLRAMRSALAASLPGQSDSSELTVEMTLGSEHIA